MTVAKRAARGRPKIPLKGNRLRACRLVIIDGKTIEEAAEITGIKVTTLRTFMRREDVQRWKWNVAQDLLRDSAYKAANKLRTQLDSENPWIAQNAANKILTTVQNMEDSQEATIQVNFGSMPSPALPEDTDPTLVGSAEGEVV